MVDKSRAAEISRLTDLLHGNPGSRLFVPLAEAYLQSEMLEEATQVLSDGLKTHTSFVAARVMLGKIYLKKVQLPEAKAQFEQVITIAPSNIPSLKGLAGIYKQEGALAEAKTAYQTILKIDPGDKEVVSAIESLENTSESTIEPALPETEESAEIRSNESSFSPKEVDSESFKNEGSNDNATANQEAPDIIQSNSQKTIAAPFTPEPGAHPVFQEKEAPAADSTIESPVVLEPHENKTMAALYMTQGHYQEAADVYERLLKRDVRDQESQAGLEEALTHLRSDIKSPLSKREKIERLQLWLEAIQGEKKR